MIDVAPLRAGERARWAELWSDYLKFYETELPAQQYEHNWARLTDGDRLHGLGAREDGELIGITHFLYHPSAWTMTPVCYLQDLFTAPASRGRGVARALIEAVAAAARSSGAAKMYWQTQVHNATARTLYDKVARHNGFIRYDYTL